jgi:hypothetical protein
MFAAILYSEAFSSLRLTTEYFMHMEPDTHPVRQNWLGRLYQVIPFMYYVTDPLSMNVIYRE